VHQRTPPTQEQENKIMNERTVKQQVGRIRHTQGRQVAETWALQRGWTVKFSKDGLTVKPLV
jgi:hypothetical protein